MKGAAAQSMNYGMSTVMTHQAHGKHSEEALKAVRKEAERLEDLLSRFRHGSEISRINRAAGKKRIKLCDETYRILERAAEISECCQGLFDVTIGPLVTLWNNCKDISGPPEEARIRDVLPMVNYKELVLDPKEMSAMLKRPGQSIDLGAIGKGYAGDKFLKVFREYGITSAFTNIGGNVVALGAKPDGSPWRIGISHPRRENSIIGLVSVTDKAVVTSGDYQRFFIGRDGRRYHHILDPLTGYPADSGLVSVTVTADSSMDADALSTVLFIAGLEKGIELIRRFPGAEAIFIDTNLKLHITAGLKDTFQANEISIN